jgi:hypothetical protein
MPFSLENDSLSFIKLLRANLSLIPHLNLNLGLEWSSVEEHLPSMCKALGFIPSINPPPKKNNNRKPSAKKHLNLLITPSILSWVWGCLPVILAFRRLKQEDREFKASQALVAPCLQS